MSNKLLKQAKTALNDDPEHAISIAKTVLKNDPTNVTAYLLIGKACILREDAEGAENAFMKSIELDPSNLTAWKGYHVLVRQFPDYTKFFTVSEEYCEVLGSEVSNSDLGLAIAAYVKKFGSNSDEFLEAYYRSILPGTPLGENRLTEVEPEMALEHLLRIKTKEEARKIKEGANKLVLKYDRNSAASRVAELKYQVLSQSEVPTLLQDLINTTKDDKKRSDLEEELLKWKYSLLEVTPADQKKELRDDVFETVTGMVVVRHPSEFAWRLYFDLSDFSSLKEVDIDYLTSFVRMFKSTGLALVLYGYSILEASPFDSKTIKRIQDAVEGEGAQKDSAEDVYELLTTGLENVLDSILAQLIMTIYYVHVQDLPKALEACNKGLSLLVLKKNRLGADFKNMTNVLMLRLAYIYTYYEAPKNFNTALKLYDKILEKGANFEAMIGKGLVLVEEGKLVEAKALLEDVIKAQPLNNDALLELSWCQVQLQEIEIGRQGLQKAYKGIEGSHLGAYQKRAICLWRIGQSYLYEVEQDTLEKDHTEKIQAAHDVLVESLKMNKSYPPLYTSLGTIYMDYLQETTKALKFFFRAFELDECELLAARKLVEDFASRGEWDTTEVLCDRIAALERARRLLMNLSEDRSWPYRVLGVAALEADKGDKAVEWFQSAIRLQPADVESWVGLGEAYLLFGRFESAIRVFNKAIVISPEHWHARYLLGVSQSLIKENEGSIETLEALLKERPDETCVIIALYESLISLASDLVSGGFFGRAIEQCIKAIELLEKAGKKDRTSQKLWKSLGDVVRVFLAVQSKIEEFPFERVVEIVSVWGDELPKTSDGITLESLEKGEGKKERDVLCSLLVVVAKCSLALIPQKAARQLRGSAWYNLGVSQLECFNETGSASFRTGAIESFKKAIQFSPQSSPAWAGLGVATVSINARVAQHCLIKASVLDGKNGEVWSNLAVLYLKYGDLELAKQAFLKAQSLQPDLSTSWIGDAIMAQIEGDSETANRLFAHGLVISNGRSWMAQLLYGISVCDSILKDKRVDSEELSVAQEVSSAHFAMSQYVKRRPYDAVGLLVACDVAERAEAYEDGYTWAKKLCAIWESEYEENESPELLAGFVQAKAQLAGFCLGLQEYDEAIEHAQLAEDLLQEADDEKLDKWSVYAKTVKGLACYFLDDFGGSLEEFKAVLQETNSASVFVILVAQALYSYGDDETKQAAMDELFEAVEKDGEDVQVLLTLAALAILEQDSEIMELVKEELDNLPLEALSRDTLHKVPEIVSYICERLGGKGDWKRQALLFPNSHEVWKHLDRKMAVAIGASGQTKIDANGLGALWGATGELQGLQREVLFAAKSG